MLSHVYRCLDIYHFHMLDYQCISPSVFELYAYSLLSQIRPPAHLR